ncbi:5-demethoxyubiquinone hydroxylase, mitochondrial isoform X1 [Hydra vulgaris]|uniref:5-demethoxyubiquinone hydroxylase, mitochondrial isoform X1 n=1 Tax=Hydra vulgaris TaxID=6087 RepID=UPI0006414C28|nr:5-demethoxyubiquinone hydroxylase, mitochondrial [Hydra vulgaris]
MLAPLYRVTRLELSKPILYIQGRYFSLTFSNNQFKSNREQRKHEQHILSQILRVDHAGEMGADRIYAGQMAVLKDSEYGSVINKMWIQEKEHLKKFNELLPKYKIRPSALLPLWNVAGFVLGAGTALMGKEAAMACTIAVEEVIGQHYDSQLRELLTENPERYKELLEVLQKFRDDELEHMETGYHYDGEKAPFYQVLKSVIQFGCHGAIWLTKKV